jgi:hypothetical protein
MTDTNHQAASGYALERVFANKLHFEGQPGSDEFSDDDDIAGLAWDWDINDSDTTAFSVALTITVQPTRKRAEAISVTVNGPGCSQALNSSRHRAIR